MVKIERSQPAPRSLEDEKRKKSGSYRKVDVIARLKADFHDKCYLCELKELQDPVVEHLKPHFSGKDRDRMFDWDNLFWACGHCNSVKNRKKYEEGILDCCVEYPEVQIAFTIRHSEVQICAREGYQDAANTASLCEEVFLMIAVVVSEYRPQHTEFKS